MATTEKKPNPKAKIDSLKIRGIFVTAASIVALNLAIARSLGSLIRSSNRLANSIFYFEVNFPFVITFLAGILATYVFYKLVLEDKVKAFYVVEFSLVLLFVVGLLLPSVPGFTFLLYSSGPFYQLKQAGIEILLNSLLLYASYSLLLSLKKVPPKRLFAYFMIAFIVLYVGALGILHWRITRVLGF